MTAGSPTASSPPPPYRLIRASRHVTDVITNIESHDPNLRKGRRPESSAEDMDLHHAIDLLLRVQQILAVRINGGTKDRHPR